MHVLPQGVALMDAPSWLYWLGLLILFMAFVVSQIEIHLMAKKIKHHCISPEHDWFPSYQDRAYECRRCHQWKGMDAE